MKEKRQKTEKQETKQEKEGMRREEGTRAMLTASSRINIGALEDGESPGAAAIHSST